MIKKKQSKAFREVLNRHGIRYLYHFTDRENLPSIIQSGGLYSWAGCDQKGIRIPKPDGGLLSRQLDCRDGLESYVRISFTPQNPMMYVSMNEGRISNPVILLIDPEIIEEEGVLFADRNATRNGVQIGDSLDALNRIHFDTVKANKYFDVNPEIIEEEGVLFADRNATRNGVQIGDSLDALNRIHFDTVKANKYFDVNPDEQPFYQAEVLIPDSIPLKYICNIDDFGKQVLRPLLHQSISVRRFSQYLYRLYHRGYLCLDDYSIAFLPR